MESQVGLAERLIRWKSNLRRGLRQHWWWFIIAPLGAFAWSLVMDRVVSATNHFIDAHLSLGPLKTVATYLQGGLLHPVTLVLLLSVVLLVALTVHAYFETRVQERVLVGKQLAKVADWLNTETEHLKPPERKIIKATPEELVEFFDGHTSIQARKLVDPYIGKWIEVSGLLGDVNPLAEDAAEVTFRPERTMAGMPVGVVTVMSFRTKEWVDRLAVLKHKNPITVQGKIKEIRSLRVYLDNCELLSADHLHAGLNEENPPSNSPRLGKRRLGQPAVNLFAPHLTPAEVLALKDHVLNLSVEILDFVTGRRNGAPRHRLANPRAFEYDNETIEIYGRRFAERVWMANSRLIASGRKDERLSSLLGKWELGEFEAAGTLGDIEEIGGRLRTIAERIES